ncbi:MAG: NAD-binding protein, partial [Chlamydiia bacterium]|nr:NAD-binding protein [Chlamydiia bacterium]
LGDILPLQDIFTSLFFVSVGMLLNIEFVVHEMALIVLTTAGVLLLKGVIITAVGISIGVPLRTVVLTAFALCQVGEFSFVLAKEGQAHGIGAEYYYQLFLAVTLLGMGLTPFLLQVSHHAADLLLRLPISTKIKAGLYPLAHPKEVKHIDHVVIVGFGVCGRNLAGSLKMLHIPYLVLEMNSDTVREERKNGEPITFGDATHEVVLRHAHLGTAKAIAIAINDPTASLRIIRAARKINPNIYMISRTRYVEESKSMFKQGADDVVPDEFGSSLEIFTRVLQQYHIPTEDIERVVTSIRNEGYEKLRELYSSASIMRQIGNSFRDIKMRTFVVESHSHVAGKCLAESALRQKHGITVLLIKRGEETLTSISADTQLQEGDRVVACGEQESLQQVMQLFHKGQAKG